MRGRSGPCARRPMSCRASSRSCTKRMPRDYYEVLGVAARRGRDDDQEVVPPARARAAPGRQRPRPRRRGEVQGGRRGLRGALGRRAPPTYDAYGHDGLKSGGFSPNFEGFGSISDLFSAFFGQGGGFDAAFGGTRMRGGAVQGGDVALAVAISLGEAARGTSVEVTYDATALCETCHGNGAEPGTPIVTCDKLPRRRARSRPSSARASARWSAPRCATSAAATAGSPSSPATPATGAA